MKRLLHTLLFSLAILLCLTGSVAADLTIGNYNLLTKQRVAFSEFEYTYTAQITNTGASFQSVTATVISSSPDTVVVEGTLFFGDVPAGGAVTSQDAFTIRHDRLVPFDPDVLAWEIQLDTTPPNLSITAPLNGSLIVQNRPIITVSYGDDESGVNTDSLAFTANGIPFDVVCQLSSTGGTCVPASPFPDGLNTLAASISDESDNTTSTQVRFTVDTAPVDIAITQPADGLITKASEIEVFCTGQADS